MRNYLYRGNTVGNRQAAEVAVLRLLRDIRTEGMITEFSAAVYVSDGDVQNNIMRCDVTIVPVFEILKIITTVVVSAAL